MTKKQDTFYPICVHLIEEGGDEPYYFVYLPDFGEATCSATGETYESAIAQLENVKADIVEYYKDTGKELPKPSCCCFTKKAP